MKDQISFERVALLHPKVNQDFTDFINECESQFDITIRVVQGLRTFQEQQALYEQGRTTPGNIVTDSQAGQSYHNYGLAIDIVPIDDNGTQLEWGFDFSRLVNLATQWSITWGGNFKFKDYDHFEENFNTTWEQLLAKYNANDFIAGTNFVNL
jgi:peptidoglycan L-alanyl-D-glutamate endopeptidase CwlK